MKVQVSNTTTVVMAGWFDMRWEFIKENKKVRKKKNTLSTKKKEKKKENTLSTKKTIKNKR